MNTRYLSALVVSSLFTSVAVAEDEAAWSYSLTPYATYSLESDLNDDNSLSVLRTGADFFAGSKLSESLRVGIAVGGEYDRYNFSDDAFPDEFLLFTLRPSVTMYVNENLGVNGGLLLGLGGEPDADVADSLVYGAFIGFNYQIAKGVWVGTGIAVSSQLSDDPIIVPLLNIEWAIADQWRLSASGLSATLTYQIDKQWSVFANAKLELREYRLSDNALLPEGVLSDDSLPVGVGVSYSPNANVTVSVSGGVIAWRQVQLYDASDNKVFEDTADLTAYASANVKLAW